MDIGSTSIKWAAYDTCMQVKSEPLSLPFPLPIVHDSIHCEIDIEKIIEAVSTILKSTIPADCILISTQMHGYLLGTGHGEVITRYISWQDTKSMQTVGGKSCFERFSFKLPPESGSRIKPNLPLCGVYAIKNIQPELFSRVKEFYTLGSYIAFRLTGVNGTHITDAAASGFYSKETGEPQFNPFPELKLPLAFQSIRPIGKWKNIAVYTPVGDQQASVMGCNLNYKTQYLLNLGTAAQLCTVSEGHAYGDYESRPYFGNSTLCTVSGLPGGREIASDENAKNSFHDMVASYRAAISKLPPREELILTGGVLKHFPSFVSAVCDELKLPCRLCGRKDALDGLIRLYLSATDQRLGGDSL